MERISLSNTAFEGSNNVYLFDGQETTLVDTGDGMETTRDQLRAALGDNGLEFADIDRVVLTHWHHDHCGLADDIQAEGDATVHVHADDAPLVSGDRSAWEEMHEQFETYLDEWGMPPEKQATLREGFIGPDRFGTFPDVEPFRDGATFPAGDRELRAVHTPGHAAGMCAFEVEQGGGQEVLSADALLPVYTPNVGGADVRVEQPLDKYLGALEGIRTAEYARAWPGHRDPIDDPSARAAEIIHHHEERAWRVLDALRRHGPCDAWTVSDDLFGELESIHILHGPGESYAHLEHLQRAGEIVREGNEYRLTDETAERLRSLSEERWDLDV